MSDLNQAQQRGAEAYDTLEALVDKNGVATVLACLRQVCLDKAEHSWTNWQDQTLSNVWTQLASKVRPSATICNLSAMTGNAFTKP